MKLKQKKKADLTSLLEVDNDAVTIYDSPNTIRKSVYLYGEIAEAKEYVPFINDLRVAKENVIFDIKINSPGGDMDTCASLITAIRETEGVVMGTVDGFCASAAIPIFLACQTKFVSPFAQFMSHDGHYATGAIKFNEHTKMSQAIHDWWGTILYSVTVPYFSEEEVESILNGSDIWLTAEEMQKRIDEVDGDE